MICRRREVVAGLAAALAVAPRLAKSEIAVAGGTLTTLSDGYLTLPRAFFFGDLPEDEVTAILAANGIEGDQMTPRCNVTLYRDEWRTILFDAGSGAEFMPSAGDLIGSLDAEGIAPEDITHIVFTHAHPDHLWGLLDDFGDPAFPEASYFIGRDEWDYWTNPATVETIGSGREGFAVGAARRLAIIEDLTEFFDDGDEILTGIEAVASFGHTPGHMSFGIAGTEPAFVIGDAVSNDHVSFAHPEWRLGSDQNADTAAATRVALMDRLAAEQAIVAGFHFGGAGIGRIERDGSGYRFIGAEQ